MEVSYVGLIISNHANDIEEQNIFPRINSMKISLNHKRPINFWTHSSIQESISKLIYSCQALYTSKAFKQTNSLIFNVIWRNKTHYLKKKSVN